MAAPLVFIGGSLEKYGDGQTSGPYQPFASGRRICRSRAGNVNRIYLRPLRFRLRLDWELMIRSIFFGKGSNKWKYQLTFWLLGRQTTDE